jgi:hypothetical protein
MSGERTMRGVNSMTMSVWAICSSLFENNCFNTGT